MASIAREFSGECFDFDRLCASCLGGLVLRLFPSIALRIPTAHNFTRD